MDVQIILSPLNSYIFLKNYDKQKAVSIVLPTREHYLLSKYRKKKFDNVTDFITAEICSLSDYTNVPREIIESLQEKLNIN